MFIYVVYIFFYISDKNDGLKEAKCLKMVFL